MANISGLYAKYLTLRDVQTRGPIQAKILRVAVERLGGNSKVVLYFSDLPRPLVLNRTSAKILVDAWGPETDLWIGRAVRIFVGSVSYNDGEVPALLVASIPDQPAPVQATPPPAPATASASGREHHAPPLSW